MDRAAVGTGVEERAEASNTSIDDLSDSIEERNSRWVHSSLLFSTVQLAQALGWISEGGRPRWLPTAQSREGNFELIHRSLLALTSLTKSSGTDSLTEDFHGTSER